MPLRCFLSRSLPMVHVISLGLSSSGVIAICHSNRESQIPSEGLGACDRAVMSHLKRAQITGVAHLQNEVCTKDFRFTQCVYHASDSLKEGWVFEKLCRHEPENAKVGQKRGGGQNLTRRPPVESTFRPPSPRYVLPPPLFHFF